MLETLSKKDLRIIKQNKKIYGTISITWIMRKFNLNWMGAEKMRDQIKFQLEWE